MTITEIVADTLVKLAYVGCFAYAWHRWINYLTARLTHLGPDPVPGIPIGAKREADGKV